VTAATNGARAGSVRHARYVVDASVAIKLYVREPLQEHAQALFARLAEPEPVELHAPDLLYVECANILWKYVRRGGYDLEVASAQLADLVALNLTATPTSALIGNAFRLAAAEAITAYDASYLALSLVIGCPLVTADERLVNQLHERYPNIHWLGHYPAPPR
jgi:predicted nucleic acid-binding protein